MGCYDTIMVPCPTCQTREAFQTKSGECLLGEYNLEDAPEEVLGDVNRHSPYVCRVCGAVFHVKLEIHATPTLWKTPTDLDMDK
jgi:hypothetical protein